MWLMECPNYDQGLVRPLVTENGSVVLYCDSGGDVWLRPQDVGVQDAIYPEGPGWEVADGVRLTPGTTRWATAEDLAGLDWDVEWRQLAE